VLPPFGRSFLKYLNPRHHPIFHGLNLQLKVSVNSANNTDGTENTGAMRFSPLLYLFTILILDTSTLACRCMNEPDADWWDYDDEKTAIACKNIKGSVLDDWGDCVAQSIRNDLGWFAVLCARQHTFSSCKYPRKPSGK
jgi:hypothetical protein